MKSSNEQKMSYTNYFYQFAKANLYNVGSSAAVPINYIFAPKNACSSIKCSLLGSEQNPHEEFSNIFLSGKIYFNKPILCVTRNPFDRAIAAYLDKIGPGKDQIVWRAFAARYNIELGCQPTFKEFLKIVKGEDKPYTLDDHFRPQVYIHNHFFVRPAFVGRVERMADVETFLQSYGIKLINFRSHAKHAASKREGLTPAEVELICEIYRQDFEAYGYEKKYLDFGAPPSIYQEQSISVEFENAGILRGARENNLFAHAKRMLEATHQHEARSLAASAIILNPALLDHAINVFEHTFSTQSGDVQTASAAPENRVRNSDIVSCLIEQIGNTQHQLQSAQHQLQSAQHQLEEIWRTRWWKIRQRYVYLKKAFKRVMKVKV